MIISTCITFPPLIKYEKAFYLKYNKYYKIMKNNIRRSK